MKIHYTTPATFEITDAEYGVIRAICKNHNTPGAGIGKVTAIRFIKDQYSLSLRQAKDIVDAVAIMGATEDNTFVNREKEITAQRKDYGHTGEYVGTLGTLLKTNLDTLR